MASNTSSAWPRKIRRQSFDSTSQTRMSESAPAETNRRPSVLKDTDMTGFSWPEEKLAGRNKVVPFRLDEALKEEGAKYSKALQPMAEKVVRDGNLVTGQNPMSAEGVGKAVAKLLARRK